MGPQCAMGLSVMMAVDGHGLFQNLWALNAPWGCLLLWYFMIMFFKNMWVLKVPWGPTFSWNFKENKYQYL